MRLSVFQILSAGLLSLSVLGSSAHEAAAEGASASNLSASFTTHGIKTDLGPVNLVSSGLPPTYNKAMATGAYHQVLLLTAGPLPVSALVVNASNLRAHVREIFGIAADTAEADATATGLDLALTRYPFANEGTVRVPFLRIAADTLEEHGTFEHSIAKKQTTVHAGGTVEGLVITGSLVGGKVIRFSGKPTPDQVLYDSPTVTITLNQSISSALISCTPNCIVTPNYIDTNALVVSLKRADLDGGKITGQISIGAGNAGGLGHF